MEKLSAEQLQEVLQHIQATLGSDSTLYDNHVTAATMLDQLISKTSLDTAGLHPSISLIPVSKNKHAGMLEAVLTLSAKNTCIFAASILPTLSVVLAAAKGCGAFFGTSLITVHGSETTAVPVAEMFGVSIDADLKLLQTLRPLPFVSSFSPVLGRIMAAQGSVAAMVEPLPSEALQKFLSLLFAEAGGSYEVATAPSAQSICVYGQPPAVHSIVDLLKTAG